MARQRLIDISVALVIMFIAGGLVLNRYLETTRKQRAEQQRLVEFTSDAKIAIQSIEAVVSALGVGVLYADYAKRTADAKVVVDQFLWKWPADLTPPVRAGVEGAMSDFALALEVWSQRITGSERRRVRVETQHGLARKLLAVPGVQIRRERVFKTDSGEWYDGVVYEEVVDLEPAQQKVWERAVQQLARARVQVGR